jgi:SAM-dependent methyltransferase
MIALFNCKSTDTVLDIGAGTGKYALPLAKQVCAVTAIEPSCTMRSRLEEGREQTGVSNLTIIPLHWEHIVLGQQIQPHDVVIASHSLTMYDLKEALLKIHQAAKREVWLFLFAGDKIEPWTRDLLIKAGGHPDEKKQPLDYLPVYSILHSIGIYADIIVQTHAYIDRYQSVEEAIEDWTLMYNISLENEIYVNGIKDRLIPDGNEFTLPRKNRIAIIHWNVADVTL